MTYTIIAFGCQMNASDSEIAAGLLEEAGYSKAPSLEDSDIIIILTCCVRESAESRLHGRLGAMKRLKTLNPDMVIGVGGCMPQREGGAGELLKRHHHVDLVFGTHNLPDLPRLVEEARRDRVLEILEEGDARGPLPVRREDGVSAWVSIIHGCDNFCSYCIVPYVRGAVRSRAPGEIVEEVEGLAREGFKQVFLLGQNVNAYGKDLRDDVSFASLLRRLDDIEGLERLRYTTSHPRDFDLDMVETVASCRTVCEHFHLPVQSGSDRILELMNRGYTRREYLDLAGAIRERIPGASITTDIIVGFPGEEEEDFDDTLDLVKRVGFDSSFTFMYSPRSGTPAAGMEDQVSPETKKERISRLIEAQKDVTLKRNQELEGMSLEVLVEKPSRRDPSMLEGKTRTNKFVHFKGDPRLKGELVSVRITHAGLWSLQGVRE